MPRFIEADRSALGRLARGKGAIIIEGAAGVDRRVDISSVQEAVKGDLRPAIIPETRVNLTPEQLKAMEPMTLEERLNQLIQDNPGVYNQEVINRVRSFVQYEIDRPTDKKPYRLLVTTDDFGLYFRLHIEWQEKTWNELDRDKEHGRKKFLAALGRLRRGDRNPTERKHWTLLGYNEEENLNLGVATVQARFLDGFPEFEDLYPRSHNGKIPEAKRDEAKKFILDQLFDQRRFNAIIGGSATTNHVTAYFEGSMSVAIVKSFGPWGLDFSELIRRIDQTGRYIDEDGRVWICTTNFAREQSIDPRTLMRSIGESFDSMRAVGNNGHRVTVYKESDLRECISRLLSYSRTSSDVIIDQDEKVWVSQGLVRRRFQLSKAVRRQLKNIPSIEVFGKRGIVHFYDRDAVEKHLGKYGNCPIADKNTGVYTTEEGSWGPIAILARRLGVGEWIVTSNVTDVPFKEGRDRSGRITRLYNEEVLRKTIETSNKTSETISPDEAREELQRLLEVTDE